MTINMIYQPDPHGPLLLSAPIQLKLAADDMRAKQLQAAEDSLNNLPRNFANLIKPTETMG